MKPGKQQVGLITATSLVVGNMIGAAIYVLPAALAGYGSISILAWVLTALGALVLAKIFGNFSRIVVNKSGGPYIYTKEGFGDFIAFLMAWGYWISLWVGNAAIAIGVVSALSFFIPALESNAIYAVLTGLGFIWFLTWMNSKGIKTSGRIQVITTFFKILPLLGFIVLGIFYFDVSNFPEFNLTGESDLKTVAVVATLTLYAFLGVECATIPAENIKDPERTVPRATMLGTGITTLIYISATVVLFGLLPVESLKNSPAPFAEASNLIGGQYSGYIVAAGAAIAALGALNGWILISGQIPMAAARDRLFPGVFKKENSKGAPALGIVIGSVLTSAVMLMNFSESLVSQFKFMILLSTLTVLVPYLFTSASYALIIIEQRIGTPKLIRNLVLAALGFSYSLWTIYGSGNDTVFYGFLLLLAGIPFYILMKYNQKKDQ
jgi:APA family basic amino acid/polyamine antiporter